MTREFTIFAYANIGIPNNAKDRPLDILVRLLKAISDESRLRILNLIVAADEICVCDIERTLGFSQTKVSRHLTILKAADLVSDRRQGLWTLYAYTGDREPTHRKILKGVAENFASTPLFQQDIMKLRQAVKSGQCTTYSVIIPGQAPRSIRPESSGASPTSPKGNT